MKKIFVLSTALLLSGMLFLAFFPGKYPPLPDIVKEVSAPVSYTFQINAMDFNQLELVHTGKGKPMWVNFKLSGSWETMRPSLEIASVTERSMFSNGKKPQDFQGKGDGKDFGKFMKDNKGKPVQAYTFTNTLTQDKKGDTYLKMTYEGPDMPMVGTLVVKGDIAFPGFVSQDFKTQGKVTLVPGTYTLDESINGFWIRVAEK